MKFTPPDGQDARHYDPESGRFICNEEHPWDGKKSTAPNGVQHVDATQCETQGVFLFRCPRCGTQWEFPR